MRYRTPFFFCLLLVMIAVDGRCETDLTVSVTGVEGRLYENVMARLRINLFRAESSLSGAEIRRLHRLAEEDIVSALQPFGYYKVTVDGRLERDDTKWQAVYRVALGDPVVVTDVSVTVIGEAAQLPELADAQARFPLRSGAVLDHQRYEKGKKELLRRTRSLGLLAATYTTSEIRVDRADNEAEIELVLDTGRRFVFGEVETDQRVISGELLARFIPFQPGEPFRRSLLQDLQRDLYRTDWFDTAVVAADTADLEHHAVPVNIRLTEQEHYNRYSFGVGYSTDIRSHIRFEWLNRLLNKQGHRAFASFLVGEQKSLSLINYSIPVADPRFSTVTASGLWNRELWEDTVTSKVSAGLAYDYLTPEYLFGVSVEVLNEDYRIGSTRGSTSLLMPGVKGSLALADDVVNTENGLRVTVDISGASQDLLSEASFLKLRGDGKLILSPIDGWRVIGRGSIGGILVEDIDDVPPSLRFYAGGEKSVRGYRYRSLGPADESGNVIGGRLLLTGSIEIERRLSRYWRAAAFYDVGNAMDDFEVDLVDGVGIGIGVALPFGQARLDLAYPLQSEGRSQAVYLSVGADL
ncbi:MAG: autotransporter assembly complex family protein [Desulfofustis sp.]|nr:autotransporter assembly complex family protein [Desulfofustis sp.]